MIWLDSSSYDDRVAAAQAMQELTLRMSEEDMRSTIVSEVIDKLHQLVAGKYFNNKETVVEGFMALIKVGNLANASDFANSYVGDTCYKQIEKNLQGGKLGYKNQILK
jgi:negative regulator of replication initiation